jgi:hypothetical protein
MTMVTATQPPAPTTRPLWIPEGVKFDTLPEALRAGLLEIINPAYQELVLEAPNALAKGTGLSYVHLLWCVLIDQLDLGKKMEEMLSRGPGAEVDHDAVDRHLRLLGAKHKLGKFLLQLRVFEAKYASFRDSLRVSGDL